MVAKKIEKIKSKTLKKNLKNQWILKRSHTLKKHNEKLLEKLGESGSNGPKYRCTRVLGLGWTWINDYGWVCVCVCKWHCAKIYLCGRQIEDVKWWHTIKMFNMENWECALEFEYVNCKATLVMCSVCVTMSIVYFFTTTTT